MLVYGYVDGWDEGLGTLDLRLVHINHPVTGWSHPPSLTVLVSEDSDFVGPDEADLEPSSLAVDDFVALDAELLRNAALDPADKYWLRELRLEERGVATVLGDWPFGIRALRDHYTDLFVEVFREVDDFSLARLDEIIRPIEGLHSLVARLNACECKIAVATSDRSDRAALAMQHLGISEAVDLVVGADMVRSPKPAPEIVERVCERLGVPAEHGVMVGDSPADVLTGQNAGCMASIGVASGLTSLRDLKDITRFVVRSIADIRL